MDVVAARGFLPRMTRQMAGEDVTIFPMKKGKMGPAVADPDRAVQTDKRGRYDTAPEIEQVGGGRERADVARFVSPHKTFSFVMADLDWLPGEGDEIGRIHPVSGQAERYRIDRGFELQPGVILFYLSRLS